MYNLIKSIRSEIEKTYGFYCFEKISCLYNNGINAWQLFKFENTVWLNECGYDVVIIEKRKFDVNNIDCFLDFEVIYQSVGGCEVPVK